jgi:outer membrane protein insertion porin family
MKRILRYLFLASCFLLLASGLRAQVAIDYANPKEYEIGGIEVSGTKYLDKSVLKLLSGLTVGDRIMVPGDQVAKAIENLWKQGLFSDISINAQKVVGDKIFFEFVLQERPRLSAFRFTGTKKSEEDDIREKIKLIKGKVVTEDLLLTTKNIVGDYYIDKGFLNTQVNIAEAPDATLPNNVVLTIAVNRKKKVKINQVIIHGNEKIAGGKLKRTMKETKEKNIFAPFRNSDVVAKNIISAIAKSDMNGAIDAFEKHLNENVKLNIFKTSKYLESKYSEDKTNLITKYNSQGFRDATILRDSVYRVNDKEINIELWVEEGPKYYFRNITWTGNTKYTSDYLGKVLGIKKGDVYNQSALEANLLMNQASTDVSSLYLDDGYLFFDVKPVEILAENDSIDIEMRIREGKQARINKVTVVGNTKTNDHVILREIRTKPGMLFSRSDIIRSQRELANLGYFNSETLGVTPKPNPVDGTVDIEYKVEEKPSDQIELSGGWGAGRIVGTLGVSFNNFSMRNIFKKGAWQPLPAGDGQKLSLRVQSNGLFFQSYNASFTEPWLGGKKPNSLSFSVFHSVQSNGKPKSDATRQAIKITGGSVGFGTRLKWPDDFFTAYAEGIYQLYTLKNYPLIAGLLDGSSNNLSAKLTLSRNSISDPIYPQRGSKIVASLQMTPPWSAFGRDIDYSDPASKYKWLEFHKTKFSYSWFQNLAGKLVMNVRTQFGFLGLYNRQLGLTPFERFYLGGSGLSGFSLDGREIVALRGYGDNTLTPTNNQGSYTGGTIYNKYSLELRYPVSLNPSATIFGLAFLEAGDAYDKFDNFNPFGVKKSAGFGVRIFLPMFGLLGLDWGYGFDDIPGRPGSSGSNFHFSIGQTIE